MEITLPQPSPGFYQYTYPTFVDKPQYICVHFLTPDGQQAFVSYPCRKGSKAACLLPVSWFQSITLSQLDGHPQLMNVLSTLFTGWFGDHFRKLHSDHRLPNQWSDYEFNQQLLA